LRESKHELEKCQAELKDLKRSLKATRLEEFEIEMKLYVDECTRLKHMLEEVMRSKDPFSDPEQVQKIEQQFQMQNDLLEKVQEENRQLAQTCAMMENDIMIYRDKVDKLNKGKKRIKQIKILKNNLQRNLKSRDRDVNQLK
jgi:paraquat-inducible protein B